MRVILTGADGFLGWHVRLRLHAQGRHVVIPVAREDWSLLRTFIRPGDTVIHLAGVNRSSDQQFVNHGNVTLARELSAALGTTRNVRVVYANTIHAGNGSAYGDGKAEAARLLLEGMQARGGSFIDVRLPNLFGEHGRPGYNSFVATFVEAILQGRKPTLVDNVVPLLHAQTAAECLVQCVVETEGRMDPLGERRRVQEVWDLLSEFHDSYQFGEFPYLGSQFRVDLFNTYRSAFFAIRPTIPLAPHTDPRGVFVETVRSRGGEGQTSVSTTVPGGTRGEHYHLNKIERFAVVSGEATVSVRRLFSRKTLSFRLSASAPTAIDMPVGWAHNITNTGSAPLITQFWTHTLFRPEAPDTFPSRVANASELEVPK